MVRSHDRSQWCDLGTAVVSLSILAYYSQLSDSTDIVTDYRSITTANNERKFLVTIYLA